MNAVPPDAPAALPTAAEPVVGTRPALLLLPLVGALGAAALIGIELVTISLALAFALPALIGLGEVYAHSLFAVCLAASGYVTVMFFRLAFAVERELAAGAPF